MPAPRISIIEYGIKPADQFMAHPQNARRHPQNQREAVADSIARLGFIAPIIESAHTGYVLDGHERVWQALQANNSSLPYVRVDVAEEDEAYVLATFDPMTALAQIDSQAFADLLQNVQADSAAVQKMLADVAAEIGIMSSDVEFKEYDESVADEVEYLECPQCGHKWPK